MRRPFSISAALRGRKISPFPGFFGRAAGVLAATAMVWGSGCAAPSAGTEPPRSVASPASGIRSAPPRYLEISDAFHRSLFAILDDSRATAVPERQAGSPKRLSPAVPAKPARHLPASVREGNPERFYRKSLALYRAGDYEKARNGFLAFLETHPDHALAQNARYWIGECHYAQGQYREAGVAFRMVLVEYREGNKIPDAFFKLGLCYHRRGKTDEARTHWERLVRRYPGSRAAGLARKYLR